MERRKNSKSLSFFFLTLMVVATTFLLSGCPGPGVGGSTGGGGGVFVSEVTNLDSVPSNDPAYVLTLFKDDEMVETLKSLTGLLTSGSLTKILGVSKGWLSGLTKSPLRSLSKTNGEEFGELISLIEEIEKLCKEDVVNKSREYLTLIEILITKPNKYDYCVEIKGIAKEKILEKFGTTNGSPLYFDFRDAVFIGLLLREIVSFYDARDFLEDLKGNLYMVMSPQTCFTNAFYNFLTSPTPNNFYSLPMISSPYNEFDMYDVFVNDFLKFRGFRKMIDHSDRSVRYFVEIYEFEVQKTLPSGYRKDGKRTLYQLFFGELPEISFVRKAGDEKLDLSGFEGVTITFGGLALTSNTKVIDVLRKLDSALPSSQLEIKITSTTSDVVGMQISLTVRFDFSKFKDSFDFKVNNLQIKGSFFNEEAYQLLFGSSDQYDPSQLFLFLDNYADFLSVNLSGPKLTIDVVINIESGAIGITGRVEYIID